MRGLLCIGSFGGMTMVMSWILCGMFAVSLLSAVLEGRGNVLSSAVLQGAQAGVTLCISIGGSICLWTGVGKLMEVSGMTDALAKLLSPVIFRLFPSAKKDKALAGSLCGNICANILGLGNAATPMGIQAARRMQRYAPKETASDEMCRLIVLNTASIQLIPSSVAAVRAALGCGTPFDILPAVWITSLCSTGIGLTAAWLWGKAGTHV